MVCKEKILIRWKRLWWQRSRFWHLILESRIWKVTGHQVMLRKQEMCRQVERKEAVSFISLSLLLIIIVD